MRSNRSGRLYLDVHSRITHKEVVDPEDLPLFHYKPDRNWLVLGTKGCTMRCPFCNTWKHSQTGSVRAITFTPEEAVAMATERNIRGISFGINEPALLHEFVADTFALARPAGLNTHVATSGMWNPDALRELVPVLSAITIGMKGYRDDFYQSHLGGDLETVRANIRLMLALGVHLEISWLHIPGVTDSPDQVRTFLNFLADLGAAPPIILLPYAPDFTWAENTHDSTMEQMNAFLNLFSAYPGYAYIRSDESAQQNTRCRTCSRTLVRRGLARQVVTSVPPQGKRKDQCPQCDAPVPYIVD